MCTEGELDMVKLIKRAGWLRSSLALLLTIITIMGSMWAAAERVENRVEEAIDEKIDLHTARTEAEIGRELERIRTEQAIQGTKLDMLLEAVQ